MDHATLDKAVQTKAFKTRVESLKMLETLQSEIITQISSIADDIFTDSLSDTYRQEVYDTVMFVARKLYKEKD
jgi:hypothetical protein